MMLIEQMSNRYNAFTGVQTEFYTPFYIFLQAFYQNAAHQGVGLFKFLNPNKVKYIYTFLLMVGFFMSGKGQNPTNPSDSVKLEISNATLFPGPKTITRTIKQDKKGNIWIAAFDGVFRCDDGKTFTNITGKVSSARFFSVLEDRKGNFWFASIGSGVYYYDGESFRNFTTREGLPMTALLLFMKIKPVLSGSELKAGSVVTMESRSGITC